VVHVIGMVLCLREPRFLDLWLLRVSRCPRVKNFALWRCNSYRP
jgi:type IV secretion system protein VirB3